MSGRDAEPIAAFFPSIDRNLMRDLDRQLRSPRQAGRDEAAPVPPPDGSAPDKKVSQNLGSQTQPKESQAIQNQVTPSSRATGMPRPTVETIVEAVEQAASTMAAMTDRIQALEQTIDDLQSAQRDTGTQLADALRRAEEIKAALHHERERGARAETLAAHHVARANRLDLELGKALSDLTRVTDAIAGTLGLPSGAR